MTATHVAPLTILLEIAEGSPDEESGENRSRATSAIRAGIQAMHDAEILAYLLEGNSGGHAHVLIPRWALELHPSDPREAIRAVMGKQSSDAARAKAH